MDFRAHQIVNIYSDDNADFVDSGWTKVERPNQRTPDGAITSMMKDENWFELVSGDRSRSGGQWDNWEATFSPAGPDGYPVPIWDKRTGKIDKQVAAHWKEHYDLRAILERDWKTIGPKLVGKLNIYRMMSLPRTSPSSIPSHRSHCASSLLEPTTAGW